MGYAILFYEDTNKGVKKSLTRGGNNILVHLDKGRVGGGGVEKLVE